MLCALFAATPALFAAAACGGGSSSTGSGGSGGSTTSSSSTGSSSSSTGSSSSSTGSSSSSGGADGGDGGCTTMCFNNNVDAAQVFEGYELKECGCAAGSPCNAMCTKECAMTMQLSMTSPCGMCLLAEAAKKTMSTCTTKAGITDCSPDPNCSAFVACELKCP